MFALDWLGNRCLLRSYAVEDWGEQVTLHIVFLSVKLLELARGWWFLFVAAIDAAWDFVCARRASGAWSAASDTGRTIFPLYRVQL